MNNLNPQTLRDQDRYVTLKTDFARTRFWQLKERLGERYWPLLRRIVDDNISNGDVCRNAFLHAHEVKKSEEQRRMEGLSDTFESLRIDALRYVQEDNVLIEEQPTLKRALVTPETGNVVRLEIFKLV